MNAYFQMPFMNGNYWIFIEISRQLQLPIMNKSALVRVMTWHQTGDEPLIDLKQSHFTLFAAI